MANKKITVYLLFPRLSSFFLLQYFNASIISEMTVGLKCLNCGATHAVNNKTHQVENIGPVIQVAQFPRLYSQLKAEK